LIEAVVAANPKTVVVCSTPAADDSVGQGTRPAIIEAWWNGEEGGDAVADVIFGDYNPAGRLPLTVYTSESQVPPRTNMTSRKGSRICI